MEKSDKLSWNNLGLRRAARAGAAALAVGVAVSLTSGGVVVGDRWLQTECLREVMWDHQVCTNPDSSSGSIDPADDESRAIEWLEAGEIMAIGGLGTAVLAESAALVRDRH